MNKTKIQWTDTTWNPITVCTKISEGCKNCDAGKMTKRLDGMGHWKYTEGFDKVICHEIELFKPGKIKNQKRFSSAACPTFSIRMYHLNI